MELLTDNEIMRRVREGEIDRLGLLFERYSAPLFNYMLRLTRRRDLSEDLVQEVFFRVLKHRKTYRDNGEFSTWLYRIARNVHIDFLRKGRPEVQVEEDLHLDMMSATDSGNAMEERIQYRRDEETLLRALERLPAEKREILILSRFERLKSHEIAKVLSCTAGSVRTRLHRALGELRGTFMELAQEKAR